MLPLYVVGSIISEAYAAELAEAAGGDPDIRDLTAKWLSDDELRIWLSAADATIFNYRKILTSGAALALRSYGIPVLLPSGRLNTVDLGEPNARSLPVRRIRQRLRRSNPPPSSWGATTARRAIGGKPRLGKMSPP
ncbi:MAG: hypothetical protein R3F11_28330 [Verrucomicrobiales bacterium]